MVHTFLHILLGSSDDDPNVDLHDVGYRRCKGDDRVWIRCVDVIRIGGGNSIRISFLLQGTVQSILFGRSVIQ